MVKGKNEVLKRKFTIKIIKHCNINMFIEIVFANKNHYEIEVSCKYYYCKLN